jgi:hypothetical protein
VVSIDRRASPTGNRRFFIQLDARVAVPHWHGIGLVTGVLRQWLARSLLAVTILLVALVSVGLTAPADALFSIEITPVFVRLGIDIEVKIGPMHFHAGWSALPMSALTTIGDPDRL